MLSSFLPPVPSLPSDPPEHFPLRKTGEWDAQVGDPPGEGQERGGAAAGQPAVLFSRTLPSLAFTQR